MSDGKFIYNKAFKAIDYCGDIEKNRGYSNYFSPNNIKRLVISPDVVVSEFYITVPNVGKKKVVYIPTAMLSQVANLPDYVPIVQIISSERICSSIEELIFVVNSQTGQYSLNPNEYDFESMIRSFNRKSGDILDTIKQRYVRLHDIVVFRGTFQQYSSIVQNAQIKADTLISSIDAIKDMSDIKEVHNEPNWYERWGSAAAAKAYPLMDGVDGHLWKYFEIYKSHMKDKLKSQKVNEYKKEKYGALEDEVKDLYSKYNKLRKMYFRLAESVEKVGLDVDSDVELKIVELWKRLNLSGVKLIKCDAISDKYPYLIEPENGMDTKEILEYNKDTINKCLSNILGTFSNSFISMLSLLVDASPITMKVALSDCETTIVVPSSCVKEAQNITQVTNYTMDGKNPLTSCINVCWIVYDRLLNRFSAEYNKDKSSRDYWKRFVS